jgi:hypothetical protein
LPPQAAMTADAKLVPHSSLLPRADPSLGIRPHQSGHRSMSFNTYIYPQCGFYHF